MADPPRTPQASAASGAAATADSIDGMMLPPRIFADMAGTFGAELFRFASRRMQAQAELLVGLSQCRTVQEVMERQTEFVRRAGTDYAEELGTMAQLAQSPSQPKQPDATHPARGSAD